LAEIKSTIDLVLEKTRDLTLSREEKQKLAQRKSSRKSSWVSSAGISIKLFL